MTDYAAAPIQPVVQGLITIVGLVPLPVFAGKGVSSIVRTVGGAAVGDFTLTLDAGLPGNSGELQPTNPNTNPPTPPQPDARTLVNARGSATNAVPGATSIASVGVSYVGPSAPPGDGGFTQIRVVTTNAAAAAVDPTGAVASGLELIVWKGIQ